MKFILLGAKKGDRQQTRHPPIANYSNVMGTFDLFLDLLRRFILIFGVFLRAYEELTNSLEVRLHQIHVVTHTDHLIIEKVSSHGKSVDTRQLDINGEFYQSNIGDPFHACPDHDPSDFASWFCTIFL